jgi:hypothetical protein
MAFSRGIAENQSLHRGFVRRRRIKKDHVRIFKVQIANVNLIYTPHGEKYLKTDEM